MAITISPDEVYSADNVEKALTEPIKMPSDLLGLKQSLYAQYGIPELESKANQAYQALTQFNQNTIEQLNQAQDQLLGMNKITGIQSKISRDRGIQQQGLASTYSALANQYQTALARAQDEYRTLASEWEQKNQLRLQFPGAKISATDSMDEALNKIAKYAKKQAEDEAFERMYGVRLSDRPKGMSKREWKRKLKKRLKKSREFQAFKEQLEIEKLQAAIESTRALTAQRLRSAQPKEETFDPRNTVHISQLINQAYQAGESWQDIADTLDALGVDISPGSYTDNKLRRLFGEPEDNF